MKDSKGLRVRWSLGAAMLAIVLISLLMVAFRPLDERTAVRLAGDLIRKLDDPGFDPSRYRVASIIPSGDGRFLRVDFVKLIGPGRDRTSATVPIDRVRASTRRWW